MCKMTSASPALDCDMPDTHGMAHSTNRNYLILMDSVVSNLCALRPRLLQRGGWATAIDHRKR